MEIKVNGKCVTLFSSNLMELVQQKNLDPGAVIIEHNFTIIPQEAWATTRINGGDTIELLSFVGGG